MSLSRKVETRIRYRVQIMYKNGIIRLQLLEKGKIVFLDGLQLKYTHMQT